MSVGCLLRLLCRWYRVNKFFVEGRSNVEEILECDVMWPPAVLTELTATTRIFYNFIWYEEGLFQVNTPPIAGTWREVQETINNEWANCSCGKQQLYHCPCSYLIACCTLRNIDYVQFVDHFFSNESYKATYTPYFRPIPDISRWSEYTGPMVYGCPTRWRIEKGRKRSTRLHNEIDTREGQSQNKCGMCGQKGHNRKMCQNGQCMWIGGDLSTSTPGHSTRWNDW